MDITKQKAAVTSLLNDVTTLITSAAAASVKDRNAAKGIAPLANAVKKLEEVGKLLDAAVEKSTPKAKEPKAEKPSAKK